MLALSHLKLFEPKFIEWKKSKTILVLIFSLLTPCIAQNEVCFEIEENPNINDFALSIFQKYVNVLGCKHIYALESISDEKVLHVAAVAAELLDNNEDGFIDDPIIGTQLSSQHVIMPIFNSESSPVEQFFEFFNGCAGAVLFQEEIDPTQPGRWGHDATVEEVLHTINACGHVDAYPQVYALEPNSSYLTNAMDIARGGQWINFPDAYPDDAWYHYDDYTCDYQCMAMEYLYWCIVTNMDLLSSPEICGGISYEWELCTPYLFETTDSLMFSLVNDTLNKLPQYAPNGSYCTEEIHIDNQIFNDKNRPFLIYPNPFNPRLNINIFLDLNSIISIDIYGLNGYHIKSIFNVNINDKRDNFKWDGTNNNNEKIASGLYFCVIKTSETLITEKVLHIK